ncbi:MAG: hypothetical protein ACPF9D_08415 [Owenweeksia sp.]
MGKLVLFWCKTNPYHASGSPAVLRKIIREMPEDEVVYRCDNDVKDKVDFPYSFNIKDYGWIDRFFMRFLWRVEFAYKLLIKTPLLFFLGLAEVIRYNPKKIFTVYFSVEWVLSARLIALFTGKELWYYAHDPFKEKYLNHSRLSLSIVQRIEKWTLRSSKLIALYHSIGKLYAQQYKISYTLLPHVIIPHQEGMPGKEEFKSTGEGKDITFAGSVYDNNKDLVEGLISFAEVHQDIRLRFFGNISQDFKEKVTNRLGNRIRFGFESNYESLLARLMESDVLYLPLSFTGTKDLPRECLQYVIPTKAIDYLNTQKPVLLHCPRDYAMYDFMTQFDHIKWIESFEDQGINKFIEEAPRIFQEVLETFKIPEEHEEHFFKVQLNKILYGN